jgi:hypothetical protein
MQTQEKTLEILSKGDENWLILLAAEVVLETLQLTVLRVETTPIAFQRFCELFPEPRKNPQHLAVTAGKNSYLWNGQTTFCRQDEFLPEKISNLRRQARILNCVFAVNCLTIFPLVYFVLLLLHYCTVVVSGVSLP